MITATGDEIRLLKNTETGGVTFEFKLANSSTRHTVPYEKLNSYTSDILTRCNGCDYRGVFVNTGDLEIVPQDGSEVVGFSVLSNTTNCEMFVLPSMPPNTQKEAARVINRIGSNINHVLESAHSIVPGDVSVDDTDWLAVG